MLVKNQIIKSGTIWSAIALITFPFTFLDFTYFLTLTLAFLGLILNSLSFVRTKKNLFGFLFSVIIVLAMSGYNAYLFFLKLSK